MSASLAPTLWPDRPAEVAHVNDIVRALMVRAEHSDHASGSVAGNGQAPAAPDDAERGRAVELDVVLGENETFIRTLNESELKFRGLVNQSLIGIAIIEAGKFSYSNAKFDEIFGYSAEEIRVIAPLDLSAKAFHPLFASVYASQLSGEVDRVERVVHGVRKNGDEIDVELHSNAVNLGGKRALIAMVMDVTKRTHAEREVLALQDKLRNESTHDPLTGLYNRRYLEEALERELILAERHGRPVSLIFGDLDHFKSVNDRYGHLAGDEVLRVFGALLKRSARSTDVYCRYGGEEFLLVLPEMAQDSAAERAQQLRHGMADAPVVWEGLSISVTASFGVATFPRDGRNGDELIAAADRAMYFAKTTGRNRVSVSAGLVERDPVRSAGAATTAGAVGQADAIPIAFDRLKGAMEGAGLGAWEADLKTMKMVWDTTVRRQYGLAASEPDPDLEQWIARLNAEDRDGVRAKVMAAVGGTDPFEIEFRVSLADGTLRWFRAFGRVYHGRDGVALRATGVNLDITEFKRVQAEKDKAGRELALFRELIDQANDAIEVVDPTNLRFLDVNERACITLGYSREELLAMRASDIDPDIEHTYFGDAEKALDQSHPALFETVHQRKDGSIYPVEVNISRVTLDRPYNLVVVRDLTERNRMKQAVQEGELRFRSLIEATSDVIAIARRDGTITYVSPAVRQVVGYAPEDLVGRNYFDLLMPGDVATARANMAALVSHPGEMLRAERHIRHKDGTVHCLESVGRDLSDLAGIGGVVVSMRDVTARKLAEADLQLANLLIEESPAVLFRWAPSAGWPVVYVSGNLRRWGYDPREFMATRRPFAEIVHPADLDRVTQEATAFVAAGATQFAQEYRIVKQSGAAIWLDDRTTVERDTEGRPVFFQGVVTDITDRKVAEIALGENELTLRMITGAALEAVILMDNEGRIAFWNRAAERILGYGASEAMGQELHALVVPERFRDAFRRGFAGFLATGRGAVVGTTREFQAVRKDGVEIPVELTVSAVFLRQGWHAVGLLHDVSARKAQEGVLARTIRALKAYSAGNSAVVHSMSQPVLLEHMCRTMIDVAGYRMAWVGLAEADAARTIRGVASASEASDYVRGSANSWADNEHGRDPARRCIRTGQAQVVRDIAADQTMAWWHEEATQHGYQSAVALPLIGLSGVFGVLMIFAGEPEAFDADELKLLSEMAGDLSYGLTALHARATNEENLRRLERSMNSTVRALGSMVEVRDPYTAGHQRRVASLAVEIGTLLGFDKDRLRGLEVGATMHDIGKIVVPAEILSRPDKLSAAEFALLKEHAAAGADIIAGVDFPWPVAEMIRQHHERMDGSGYPRGLKADQILLEARIIAVADVVEAMSSHRPYRLGNGIDAALAEIERGRGTAFDADVADTCLKAFRQLGYQIPE